MKPSKLIQVRDRTVDILRGLAIFTMAAANTAGSILVEPHPFLLRFYGTFAAPMFIMLSGMMVAMTSQKSNRTLSFYLLRGGLVILTGAAIDTLIWQLYPFVSFDVLYLIGFSIPVAYGVSKLSEYHRWILVAVIFALTPVMQKLLGYSGAAPDVALRKQSLATMWEHAAVSFRHFVIDGWFPVFPWLGFSLFGVALTPLWERHTNHPTTRFIMPALPALTLGALIWWRLPGPLYTREGYSEMFYPPTIGYIVTAIGVILCALCVVASTRNSRFWRPWELMGQCSLFLYVTHYALIRFVMAAYWDHVAFPLFVQLYIGLVGVLIGLAYGVRWFKNRFQSLPFLVRFFIGS